MWAIAVILVIFWVLGLVSGYTLGSIIHVLLVIAQVVMVIGFLHGRRV